MRLEEAMGKKVMPMGEGTCIPNWGFIIGCLVENNTKDLELTGRELNALIIYLVNNIALILNDDVVEGIKKDHADFTFWGIHITKI